MPFDSGITKYKLQNMETTFTWTKGLFSNSYRIASNNEHTGSLEKFRFSRSAEGLLNGKAYNFNTKGFFKQHTEIIDAADKSVIGKIEYNSWNTKAKIIINGKTVHFRYANFLNTKWQLVDSDGIILTFKGSVTSGQIDTGKDDAALILSGLYVVNYFWHVPIAIFIIVLLMIVR